MTKYKVGSYRDMTSDDYDVYTGFHMPSMARGAREGVYMMITCRR